MLIRIHFVKYDLKCGAPSTDHDKHSLERKIHCVLLQSTLRETHVHMNKLNSSRISYAVRNFGEVGLSYKKTSSACDN